MMIHSLKSKPEYFKAVWHGAKTFEIRNNDRDFHEGDFVILGEWRTRTVREPKGPFYITDEKEVQDYSGGIIIARISYVTTFEQKEGYVVFGLEILEKKMLLNGCGQDPMFVLSEEFK